jgi:uncharacterized protein
LSYGACGFKSHSGHVHLSVRLQPRARRDEVVGERGGAIVIRVTAPPVDGRANDALCRLIAKAAGVELETLRAALGV